MPRQNGTGPMGEGAGTGRGLGPCGGGMGFGRGLSRGFGGFWKFGSRVSPKDEKQMLEGEAKLLEEDLQAVKERLSELNAQK